ncbi:hypothetical protein B0H16DRAFT_1473181 [Mycena metata]|uniref:DUF6589 domain-containing protein n=1 Tax=Mycena metata TaxID=1033252 RepID=A0AAD7HKI9_9AGAR|nr:hypothetical protein B0H16DRAFT_1473181 [Mycena metata]
MALEALSYDHTFWREKLPDAEKGLSLEMRLHLIFSLTMYLSVSVRQLMHWIFTTDIPSVFRRVSIFMGFFESEITPEAQFGPAMLFGLWRTRGRWPRAQSHLREMTIPCAHELALQDSNRLINNPHLQIKMKTLTIHKLRALLHPQKLIEVFKELAPFMWQILHTFCASPNNHRRRKAAEADAAAAALGPLDEDVPMPDLNSDDDEDWADDPNLESGESDPDSVPPHWGHEYVGFSRNPVFAILLSLSMLIFVRNRATNVLPLILGLFFKISGTSSRVVQMLSNAGICVSSDTIERLKVLISEDAIGLAVELITSGQVFFTIFDNINIFLRKSQQRLNNTDDMINATNCAIIGIDDVEPLTAADLAEKLALRGNRAKAKPTDILPTPEDDEIVGRSFVALIAEMIVAYCPGNREWEERKDIATAVAAMMPLDRPLPPVKTNARPFGVFDVNEGSKKGVVKVLQSVQERSTLSQKIWSSISRIFVGDWLTSNNLRGARRDRTDDVNAMERLEYADELSAPWHFALQATHMLMRTHYGHAVEDPASLAAHKGLLNRKWDVNKPNYAAAKSLIRHSLIARILHCVMVLQGFTLYSQLAGWSPTLEDIQTIALVISNDFATATAARKAQAAGDDWMAHSIYFIRDSLFFMLFEKAVSFADAGQLIRVLKYWGLAFRGVGQHNYARECAEVLVRWTYELPAKLRLALERSWFVNRFGKMGRFIPSDLYLEQLNYWVKRVYIASGAGVTIQYIIRKGSACVEAFRDISHMVANFFGDPDRARRHKEVKFQQDIEALVSEMQRLKFHVVSTKAHFVPAPPPKKISKKTTADTSPRSAVVDVFVKGSEEWNSKFNEFIRATTYDKELGYPLAPEAADTGSDVLRTGTAFDNSANPLTYETYADLHGNDGEGAMGAGALGGGDEFYGSE